MRDWGQRGIGTTRVDKWVRRKKKLLKPRPTHPSTRHAPNPNPFSYSPPSSPQTTPSQTLSPYRPHPTDAQDVYHIYSVVAHLVTAASLSYSPLLHRRLLLQGLIWLDIVFETCKRENRRVCKELRERGKASAAFGGWQGGAVTWATFRRSWRDLLNMTEVGRSSLGSSETWGGGGMYEGSLGGAEGGGAGGVG